MKMCTIAPVAYSRRTHTSTWPHFYFVIGLFVDLLLWVGQLFRSNYAPTNMNVNNKLPLVYPAPTNFSRKRYLPLGSRGTCDLQSS